MTKITYKKVQLLLVILTLGVLLSSLYLQYIVGLTPCPLCLMQRVCVFLLLITLGLRLNTQKKAHFLSVIQILISGAGLFFSLRQLWLQSLPPGKAPACMPGLDVLIHYFPWQTIAKALFWGSGDCAETTKRILGLSLSGWSALYFTCMVVASLVMYLGTFSHKNN